MMPPWKHPLLGPIEALPPRLQPKKVWAHFYSSDERWDRISPADPRLLRSEVERLLGVTRQSAPELPRASQDIWPRVRDLARRHHDVGYGRAYGTDMVDPTTCWTPTMDRRQRHHALTPRSIYIVLQLDRPSWVVTAFRPHPPTAGVDWSEADFRRHAEWKFQEATGMSIDRLARVIQEKLTQAARTRPASARDLWWLVSAVGYGRLLRGDLAVQAALRAAEACLGEADPAIVSQLRDALDWRGALQRVAAGLKEDRPEDLEAALSNAEDLLVAAPVLGAGAKAKEFCAEAEALLAWVPAEWDDLALEASRRLELLGGDGSPAGLLWAALADGVTGALLRAQAGAARPAARHVDALLPSQPPWQRFVDLVNRIASRAASGLDRVVRDSLADIRVHAPAPTMGAAGPTAEPWAVRGGPAPGRQHLRVFVVDCDYPEGQEVTARFHPQDGYLWSLDRRDERALIVLIAGDVPVPGETLEDVLSFAAEREEVAIGCREVSPPT